MPKDKKKKYVQKDVDLAVKAVNDGMPLRIASDKFGVPKSTLYVKSRNIVPVNAKMGPATYLTDTEEKIIIEWIFYLSDHGFPVSKNQLLDNVRSLIIELARETPFTDNRPGRHWYERFLHRHPEVAKRVAQNLTYSRASVTEQALRNWFSEVYKKKSK